MLSGAPNSCYPNVCLSLALVAAASHEFPCGKDSELHTKIVSILLEFIITGYVTLVYL